ncbi:ATP-dependent DNA helicase [Mycena venus]|uniref:ATP-dependent DNA helicase n=1 Tax=Mycena venus TaxID=2733690 RepID=A0A8H6YBS1_9AGAR|nr:ATP-dependent DNA helicase [Mycena venus]
MSSITLRRCSVDRKSGKTMYDRFLEEAQAMGNAILSVHEIDVSFFRDMPNSRGNIYYHTSEGTPFLTNFIAEIGSEAQGTWMASYPKKTPPPYKLPYTDGNSRSHRMVLALRCPTGAPVGLCSMFQDGAAVYDTLRVSDEQEEIKNGENFELTDQLMKLRTLTVRPLLPLVLLVLLAGELPNPQIVERKIGDTYPPSVLPDHRGPCFAHDKAVVTQRDYVDADGNLIAPAELYSTLVEGTLVLVTVYFATYIMKDQKNDRGEPQPDRKVYHLLVDKLKVLDRGDGEPWDPAIPTMPERRAYSPGASPKKRARDSAVDAAFNNFGKASPSTSKRHKRNAAGTQ